MFPPAGGARPTVRDQTCQEPTPRRASATFALRESRFNACSRFSALERAYHDTHLDRLAGQSLQSIETSSLHLDIISDMRRINSFFCSTAYAILEQAGKLRKSRLRDVATGIHPARPDLAPNDHLASPTK